MYAVASTIGVVPIKDESPIIQAAPAMILASSACDPVVAEAHDARFFVRRRRLCDFDRFERDGVFDCLRDGVFERFRGLDFDLDRLGDDFPICFVNKKK
jgi:hypothetical protein